MLVPELAAQGLCLVLSALDAALPSRRGGKFSGGRSRTRISRVEAVLLLYKTAFSDMNREVRHITIVVRKSDNSRIQQKLKRRDRVRNGIRGGHVDRSDFPTALNGERDGGTRAKRFCFGLPSFLPHSLHLDRFPRLYLRRRAIPASIIAINAPLAGGIIPPLRSCRTIKPASFQGISLTREARTRASPFQGHTPVFRAGRCDQSRVRVSRLEASGVNQQHTVLV